MTSVQKRREKKRETFPLLRLSLSLSLSWPWPLTSDLSVGVGGLCNVLSRCEGVHRLWAWGRTRDFRSVHTNVLFIHQKWPRSDPRVKVYIIFCIGTSCFYWKYEETLLFTSYWSLWLSPQKCVTLVWDKTETWGGSESFTAVRRGWRLTPAGLRPGFQDRLSLGLVLDLVLSLVLIVFLSL